MYTKALFAFDHVVRLTPEKAFAKKAPCAGWTGQDVYEHAVGGVKMAQSFAATGRGPKTTPKLGTDPLGAWVKQRDAVLEALDRPGALQTVAHDPFGPEFGPMPVDTLIAFMGADLTVHAWDLARTARVDDRLDAGLCKATLAAWGSLPESVVRMPGMFGPKVKPAKGADAQTRMLNFLGRTV